MVCRLNSQAAFSALLLPPWPHTGAALPLPSLQDEAAVVLVALAREWGVELDRPMWRRWVAGCAHLCVCACVCVHLA